MPRSKLELSIAAVLAMAAPLIPCLGLRGLTQENPEAKSSSKEPSSAAKPIASMLELPISMRFPVPFDDVLQYIKNSTKKGRDGSGILLYVDPNGLEEVRRSLASPVTVDSDQAPVRVVLQRVLGQLQLAYVVKENFLFISSPRRVEREKSEPGVASADSLPSTKAVLIRLEEPIPIPFFHPTRLDEALKYVGRSTMKGPGDSEIKILLDPNGLREAGRAVGSCVRLELEHVPLKTTLRLMLSQLDLAYIVKDGKLVISSIARIQRLQGKDHGP
jgi:hypothetical protein